MTAYVGPGSDTAAYERKIRPLVVGPCYRDSLAAGYVDQMEDVARQGGAAAVVQPFDGGAPSPAYAVEFVLYDLDYATRLDYWRADEKQHTYRKAVGDAVWIIRDEQSELLGPQQSLTLVRGEEGPWRVAGGQSVPAWAWDYEHQVGQKIEDVLYGR